jgi:16S rRNA (guanine1516-N2)-methyltransferase
VNQKKCTQAIAVLPATKEEYDKAIDLSRRLQIPLVEDKTEEFDLLLLCSAQGLAIIQTGKKKPGPVMADLVSPTMEYRRRHGGGRSQPMAKAVGLKGNRQPTVIDATAGLGRDAFILAHLGCYVHMIERSPVIGALLEDGLQRALQSPDAAVIIRQRLQLTIGDSIEILQNIQIGDRPDVIYLDPMYPHRTKSSLVKKEMRILRALAGEDLDAPGLLEAALACTQDRVVVKRPRLAAAIKGIPPTTVITSKNSRYDIYLIQ